jgi:hypothetical protein
MHEIEWPGLDWRPPEDAPSREFSIRRVLCSAELNAHSRHNGIARRRDGYGG